LNHRKLGLVFEERPILLKIDATPTTCWANHVLSESVFKVIGFNAIVLIFIFSMVLVATAQTNLSGAMEAKEQRDARMAWWREAKLLAIFSEVRLVAAFWLRAGNSSCANNVVGFFLDLWEHLPAHLRVRVVRADSGFCVSELLRLWERLRLKFVVVARLSRPLQGLIRKETQWAATEVTGTDVAEVTHTEADWPADIAHLLMMRGCEAKYWASANQHPIHHPAAGV
jgi:hypothetical protein